MFQVWSSTGIVGVAVAVFLAAVSLACEVDAREMGGSAVSSVKDVGRKVGPGASAREVLAQVEELEELAGEADELARRQRELGEVGCPKDMTVQECGRFSDWHGSEISDKAELIAVKCQEYVPKAREQLEKWMLEYWDLERDGWIAVGEMDRRRGYVVSKEMEEMTSKAARVNRVIAMCGEEPMAGELPFEWWVR